MPQEEINRLMTKKASEENHRKAERWGPFIFGRGKRLNILLPLEYLLSNPGVTSAISVPAYAGIPLTHRKYSSSIGIVTGNEDANKRRALSHGTR